MFQIDESNSMDIDMPLDAEFVVLSDVHLDKPKVSKWISFIQFPGIRKVQSASSRIC